MNSETLSLMIEFAVKAVVIMALIAFMAVITPKIAAFIQKRHPQINEKPKAPDDGVKGVYDKQSEKYDLNYKIYNTDIYGVDFKHGKKRKQDGK